MQLNGKYIELQSKLFINLGKQMQLADLISELIDKRSLLVKEEEELKKVLVKEEAYK
jgi:hypothetical protein